VGRIRAGVLEHRAEEGFLGRKRRSPGMAGSKSRISGYPFRANLAKEQKQIPRTLGMINEKSRKTDLSLPAK
jgi:hypothetical protein